MSGWGAIYNNTVQALQAHSMALANLQSQVASGARLLWASDDPAAANRVLHLRQQTSTLEGYKKNLDYVLTSMEQISSSLQEISPILARVRELTTQATSGTYNDSNRTAIGEEINMLLEQVVSTANFESLGRYLFSGASVSTTPYRVERTDGKISAVIYQGGDETLSTPVSLGVTAPGVMVGDEVFRSRAAWHPVLLGNTGARAGQGASTVEGQLTLDVSHVLTTYHDDAGTGIAAGASSAAGDTILGTSHALTIDADNSKVRLDDGAWVDYTNEADLEVANAAGDKVFIDVSGVVLAAGTETVAITASASLSIDGGATSTVVNTFGADETVLDSTSGRVLSVDARYLTRIGDEPVRVAEGSYDLFGTIIALRDLMTNEHQLAQGTQLSLLSDIVGRLDAALTGISQNLTSVGGRLGAMDGLNESLQTLKENAEGETAKLVDADLVSVATDLARTQTLYEMTLATAGKLLNLSLLDFI